MCYMCEKLTFTLWVLVVPFGEVIPAEITSLKGTTNTQRVIF